MAAMKEMFRNVIQTVMEVEMDEELERERCQRAETSSTRNYRNGYRKNTVMTLHRQPVRHDGGNSGSSRASTASSGKSRKTSPVLPTMSTK